ncbi:hypothetical protein J7K50_03355 [bacterium]|nr:hypothetical protein [bacterium]
MARLVDKYRDEKTILNVTGNSGTHYNGVTIVATYDDFIVLDGESAAERAGGNWRGGRVNVLIGSITRFEPVAVSQKVRLNLKGR